MQKKEEMIDAEKEATEILRAWSWHTSDNLGPEGIKLRDLISEALLFAIQQGREMGLEEAASVADDIREEYPPQHSLEARSACREIAQEIRNLSNRVTTKSKELL